MTDPRPNVVVLDDYEHAFPRLARWDWVAAHCRWRVMHQPLRGEALVQALQDVDALVLMRDRTPLPPDLLAQMPRLKLVVFTGTRNQTLDMAALKARGVTVCHTGWGPSKDSTAELTWALMLAAYKRLPENMAGLQAGHWRTDHALLPVLRGETLGLLGLGEIGSRVARIGLAFGMRVLAWSPNMTPERAQQHGVEAATLQAVLSASRLVSLHLVASSTTRHLINRERLALMRRDAILINTSRSALVHTGDLIEALQSGQLAQAAIDVFDEEPLPTDHPLRRCPGLLLTPHLGFVAQPVFQQFVTDVQATLTAWLKGEPLERVLS
jgi:phosphoglycerate dehydrogenase-like enzyme